MISVSVVYATTQQQFVHGCELTYGASVGDALAVVAQLPGFSRLDLSAHTVGIFGEVCSMSRVLEDGDRVEIYRPLQQDAKAARHRRAAQQKEG